MPEVIQIGSGKAGILTSSCVATRFLLLTTFPRLPPKSGQESPLGGRLPCAMVRDSAAPPPLNLTTTLEAHKSLPPLYN